MDPLCSPEMPRRAFMAVIAGGLLAAPLVAEAQPAGKTIPRIGYLDGASLSASSVRIEAFRQGLRELGYVEGQNIAIEWVQAEGQAERLPALAAELLRRKVDVIVTVGTTAIRAAKDATSTVPIIMAGGGDPVGSGLVQSLSRPGGNITGVSLLGQELMEKNLDLLKQALPSLTTVTLIRAAANPANRFFLQRMEAAARRLGLRVVTMDIREPAEFEAAFSRMTGEAAFMLLDPMFRTRSRRIAELAIKRHLPLMTAERAYAEDWFLLTYGASLPEVLRLAAVYVDKILKGAKPGDLPIEQPTKFLELVINLKTAKALGLTIPPSLLQRADQVIE